MNVSQLRVALCGDYGASVHLLAGFGVSPDVVQTRKEDELMAVLMVNVKGSLLVLFSEPLKEAVVGFVGGLVGWRQDNRNRSNQESKFDFLATRQRLVKIGEGQQKIKIVRTNRQSNLQASCQSILSLCRHPNNGHPSLSFYCIPFFYALSTLLMQATTS